MIGGKSSYDAEHQANIAATTPPKKKGLPTISPKERESADMAVALTRKVGNNYYQGTVPPVEKKQRRAKNKQARATRSAQRRSRR